MLFETNMIKLLGIKSKQTELWVASIEQLQHCSIVEPSATIMSLFSTSIRQLWVNEHILPSMASHLEVISHNTRAMEYTSACLKDSMFSRLILDSNTSGAMYLAVPTWKIRETRIVISLTAHNDVNADRGGAIFCRFWWQTTQLSNFITHYVGDSWWFLSCSDTAVIGLTTCVI